MDTGKVVLGVLAGVAAGAVLGVLFAPDKGCNTRRKISKTGEDFTQDLKDKFEEFIETITQKFEEVKEEVIDFTEEAQAAEHDKHDRKKTSDEPFVR
ncbi:MAG: YtxH domain-containing protein [Bacteroidales bacterium]